MDINLGSIRVAFAVNNNNEFEDRHFGDAFNTKYLNTKEQRIGHIFETVNHILS